MTIAIVLTAALERSSCTGRSSAVISEGSGPELRLESLKAPGSFSRLMLLETNESVISRHVNDILRVLRAISIIVLPLTLIASIWGERGRSRRGRRRRLLRDRDAMAALLIGVVAYICTRG